MDQKEVGMTKEEIDYDYAKLRGSLNPYFTYIKGMDKKPYWPSVKILFYFNSPQEFKVRCCVISQRTEMESVLEQFSKQETESTTEIYFKHEMELSNVSSSCNILPPPANLFGKINPSPCFTLYEVILRLGQEIRIEVSSLINRGLFSKKSDTGYSGEICDTSGPLPKPLSYSSFAYLPNEKKSFPVDTKFPLNAPGKKRVSLQYSLEKSPPNECPTIDMQFVVQHPRTESIMKLAKFYNNLFTNTRKLEENKNKLQKILHLMNIPDSYLNDNNNYFNISFSSNMKYPLRVFFTAAHIDRRDTQEILTIIKKLVCRPGDPIKEKWVNFMKEKNSDGLERISINMWANFLSCVQNERVKKDRMVYLAQRYPNPKWRRANERAENQSYSKIEKWLNNDTKKLSELRIEIQTLKLWKPDRPLLECTRRMFFEHLYDPVENCIMDPEKEKISLEDMDFPICDYWIDSSYKTHLTGDQLNSSSSVNMYCKALLRGCRFVEVDVRDGSAGEIIVYNGKQVKSKLSFWDCIEAICQAAFVTSEYPVLLNLDVHCKSQEGKRIMAKTLNHLLKQPQFVNANEFKNLWVEPQDVRNAPLTPRKLMHKILIITDESSDQNHEIHNFSHMSHVSSSSLTNTKYYHKLQEWKITSQSEETGMNFLAKDDDNIHTWRENNKVSLTRIYPKRMNSSNYIPISYWNAGCQIVSLNFQTEDIPIWLNEGKFMRSARSGYVLKPPHLRKQNINNKILTPQLYLLTIKVISGWCLPRPWGKQYVYTTRSLSEPEVAVSFWSSAAILTAYKKEKKDYENDNVKTTGKNKDPHHPVWNSESFEFQGTDEELDMVLFEVKDTSDPNKDKNEMPLNKTIGYYAITVADMRTGLRVVPLKGEEGVPLVSGSLFVWIDKKNK